MNDRLRIVLLSLSSALLLTAGFVINPALWTGGAGGAAHSTAAFAQGKKKPAGGQQVKRSGPNLNNSECNNFLARLRDKVDEYWDFPDGKNRVTLTATIGQDGAASEINLSSTPSNQTAEQRASEAFAKAQPLETLPPSAGTKVKLTLTFDSYSDAHGDTNRNLSAKMDPIMSATP